MNNKWAGHKHEKKKKKRNNMEIQTVKLRI